MGKRKILSRPFLILILILILPGWSAVSASNLSGAFTVDGKTVSESDKIYLSNMTDLSAIYVTNNGTLTLSNATISTTGNTSSQEESSFYGLNGALLANNGSSVVYVGGSITSTGTGANGAIPTGNGTSIILSNLSIITSGDGAHGVMATQGSELTLNDVTISTSGPHGAPVATDRGGGFVDVNRANIHSTGTDSPGIYSTGEVTIQDSSVTSIGTEACVIEGSNSVTISDSNLSGGASGTGGVMIYQSFSGDAQTGKGTFTMGGGSYIAAEGPAFFVTNTKADINLEEVNVTVLSGILVKATGTTRWGVSGKNGGVVTLTAVSENLTGSIMTDTISSIGVILMQNSTLTSEINSSSLTLVDSSSWKVTGNSTLTSLIDSEGVSGDQITNIFGNGFKVTYDPNLTENAYLQGKEYNLTNGGTLSPKNASSSDFIPLQVGWNHVSVPRRLANGSDTATIFSGVNSSGHSVLMFQNDILGYIPLKAIDPITPLQGYWLYSTEVTTVPIEYDELVTGSGRNVTVGWSSVGGWSDDDVSANETFTSLQDGWSYAVGYNAALQQYEDSIVRNGTGNQSDTRPIHPYQGYWLYCSQNGTYQSGTG